ncbi:unnamed protein product [Peronospora belbahrii]|uniref:CBF1-interacting co-repressor CIR N-terminal domain-containing protein n=1 Tax=Peronospora belbahrii TaxID=622444 RepID=A0AAU9L275_9STRA|nr:unnamed protein product [Peronospora belbahrii]CAH0515405.1 unnamed protein product [Peronospora belbahrii]
MGGGGLRILPHKKWHVWRRENIERVLKDERENEEKKQDLEVKERRLAQEKRAQQLLLTEGHDDSQQHINLFQAEEAQASSKDIVKYSKKKTIGQDETLKRYGIVPWYAWTEDEKEKRKELTVRQERKRKRELEVADPLKYMRPKEKQGLRLSFTARSEQRCGSRYDASEEGLDGSDRRKYCARYDRSSVSPKRGNQRYYNGEDDIDKASKHRKKKSKSKHKLGKEAVLQELRRERQEREASERRRAERLMYG